jgi:hypothetical protein
MNRTTGRIITALVTMTSLAGIAIGMIVFASHCHAEDRKAAINRALWNPANGLNAKSFETFQIDSDPANVAVYNYGNDVYYFPLNGAPFLKGLSKFLDKHPALEVTAMAFGSGSDFFGNVYTSGCYVTFSKKRS